MKLNNIYLSLIIFVVLLAIGIYIFVTNSLILQQKKLTTEEDYFTMELKDETEQDLVYVDSLIRQSISDKYILASLVSYPLYRPYPLRTIDSAEQFIAYYDTIIEQEMIDVFRCTKREWIKMYYRDEYHLEYNGDVDWVVKNVGEMDSANFKIYQIPLSKKEKNLREKYLRRERKTLMGYDGYEIENCLELEDGTVYRILVSKSKEMCECPNFYSEWLETEYACHGQKLIALEYAPNEYDKIKAIHEGCLRGEGSCGSTAYIFDDKWFGQWSCVNYYILHQGTTIGIFEGKQFIDIPCKRTCWRDYE